jgi:hypothetical protein
MTNRARGFVPLQLGDETLDISLSLDALAEIEDAFDVDSFEQAPLFKGGVVSARTLRKFLDALLKGNGHEATPARAVALGQLQPSEVFALMESLFVASGLAKNGAAEAPKDGAAPLEDASAGGPG